MPEEDKKLEKTSISNVLSKNLLKLIGVFSILAGYIFSKQINNYCLRHDNINSLNILAVIFISSPFILLGLIYVILGFTPLRRSKNASVISIILLFLLFLGVFRFFSIMIPIEIEELAIIIKNESLCRKAGFSSQRDTSYCLSAVVVKKNDETLCGDIPDEGIQWWCYIDIAKAKKDSGICDKISHEWHKDYCYEAVALINNDSAICDKISDEWRRDRCYTGIAMRRREKAICEKISNIEQKDICYEKAQNSPEN